MMTGRSAICGLPIRRRERRRLDVSYLDLDCPRPRTRIAKTSWSPATDQPEPRPAGRVDAVILVRSGERWVRALGQLLHCPAVAVRVAEEYEPAPRVLLDLARF